MCLLASDFSLMCTIVSSIVYVIPVYLFIHRLCDCLTKWLNVRYNLVTMYMGVQVTQLQPTLEEEEENSMSQVMAETPGTREIPDAAYSSKVDSPLTEGLSREALRAKELIDALVTHCELVGRFRRLVQAARDDGSERQERMFLELGTTQAQTCRQQRQQLHRALALLGEEQALMSQLLKANDMCSLELRLWEQLAGSAPHGADSRPSQPLQVCLLTDSPAPLTAQVDGIPLLQCVLTWTSRIGCSVDNTAKVDVFRASPSLFKHGLC